MHDLLMLLLLLVLLLQLLLILFGDDAMPIVYFIDLVGAYGITYHVCARSNGLIFIRILYDFFRKCMHRIALESPLGRLNRKCLLMTIWQAWFLPSSLSFIQIYVCVSGWMHSYVRLYFACYCSALLLSQLYFCLK